MRRLLAAEPAELDHFEASLTLLERWLDEHARGEGTVAVFACGALDFVQGWRLPIGRDTPSLFTGGRLPGRHVRPVPRAQGCARGEALRR